MRPGRVTAASLLVNTIAVQVITYAYRPTLAYAALDAGGAPAFLGVMSGLFAVPALLLAIPAGHLVDRASERLLSVTGAILMALSLVIAVAAPQSVGALLAATLILGIAHLGCIVAQQTLVANNARRGRSDSAFGWYTLAASAGQAVGPLLLAIPGNDSQLPPVQLIFSICLALCGLLVATGALMPRRERQPRSAGEAGAFRGAARNLRQKGTARALVASGLALASVDITLVYWPALGDERGLAPILVSAMLVLRALATMASRGLLGWSTRAWGRRAVTIVTLLASAIALAVTALPVVEPVLLIAAVVYGLGIGACQPITMAWLSSLAAPGQRGAMLSLRLVGNRLAQATVPAAAGFVAVSTGGAGVIIVLSVTLLLATWAGAAVPDSEHS